MSSHPNPLQLTLSEQEIQEAGGTPITLLPPVSFYPSHEKEAGGGETRGKEVKDVDSETSSADKTRE